MVCFSYRFIPAVRYMKDIIDRGLIGDIYHVSMQYFQAWGLPDANVPLVWRYIKDRTGSGALGDLGSHGIDLVRFVTGKEYKKVIGHADTFVHERKIPGSDETGKVDVDDYCNYMAEMDGRTSVNFRLPALHMEGAIIRGWRYTEAREPWYITWTQLPIPTKLKSVWVR